MQDFRYLIMRLVNVQDWKKKSMKCRDSWNSMKIRSMNSDRHFISIFICIIPRLPAFQNELELSDILLSSHPKKMDAKDAINLYKSRDVSEKVFQADKSYLGNHCLRVAPEEAASNKIFIGLLALIIRCRIYIALKEKELAKKPNYLTVPAAIRELEKIEPTRQLDKVYRLDHAVTKTQKVILSAFGMDWNHVKYRVENISKILKI